MLSLSTEEKRILEVLKKQRIVNLSELAVKLRSNKSSLYYQLKSLKEKGLVDEKKTSAHVVTFKLSRPEKLNQIIEKQQKELENILLMRNVAKSDGRKLKLVFCDWYVLPDNMLKTLSEKYDIVTYPDSPTHISEDLFEIRCGDADIVVTFFSVHITKELLLRCKNMKALVLASISTEMVDTKACKELGVEVYTVSIEKNYKKGARVEFIFISLFSLLRLLHMASEELRLGKFDFRWTNYRELRGMKVGIVGVNREGKLVVPMFRMFGCSVLVANPDDIPVEPTDLGLSSYSSLNEIFTNCDVVIFAEDYGHPLVLDEKLLNEAMSVEYLLFASNNVHVDLDILRELIISKKVKGVFYDYYPDIFNVYESFPQSNYRKIINFPNVWVTPEVGFYTKESMLRNNKEVFETLQSLNYAR